MENNVKKALDDFIGIPQEDITERNAGVKKVILDEREGLIERVDKILVTKEGKQLLREQY